MTFRIYSTLYKALPYPSEKVKVEQEKVQNQLKEISIKLNEIANKKEPVFAFRATSVKDLTGNTNTQAVSKHGKFGKKSYLIFIVYY